MIQQARALPERLVSFRTVSSGSNRPLIEFCAAWLAKHEIESVVVPSPDRDKANLFAAIGPLVPAGLSCQLTPMWCPRITVIGRPIPGT